MTSAARDGHGVTGWGSDHPLCISCARIRIWGTAEPWPKRRKGGV